MTGLLENAIAESPASLSANLDLVNFALLVDSVINGKIATKTLINFSDNNVEICTKIKN